MVTYPMWTRWRQWCLQLLEVGEDVIEGTGDGLQLCTARGRRRGQALRLPTEVTYHNCLIIFAQKNMQDSISDGAFIFPEGKSCFRLLMCIIIYICFSRSYAFLIFIAPV